LALLDFSESKEIKDKELKKVFAELDELIGLASVKRAMREFYATVTLG
jgi:hypothetical protein